MDTDHVKIAIREFSRLLGVSDTAVRQRMYHAETNPYGALKASLTEHETNKRPMLWKDVAMQEWVAAGLKIKNKALLEEIISSDVPAEKSIGGGAAVAPDLFSNSEARKQAVAAPKPGEQFIADANGNIINASMSGYKAKEMEVIYSAGLVELQYRKAIGELVPIKEVYATFFEYGKEVRTMLEQMSARCIGHIMAAENEREGKMILDKEIEDVLELMARGPKAADEQDEDD